MRKLSAVRLILIVVALTVLLFCTAEKLDILRTDSLVAIACVAELTGRSDAWENTAAYRDVIQIEAARQQLPPEMLAAIINGHRRALTPFRRMTDCAGSALGRDLSLGPAQIRISTAVSNDRLDFNALSATDFKAYRRMLLDPAQNIRALAQELRILLERAHRFPGINAQQLIHAPFVMALVMSEYRMGRQRSDSASSKLSANAFQDLSQLTDGEVFMFDRNTAERRQIQHAVSDYLEYINCDSGIFNAKACRQWRESATTQVMQENIQLP